MKQVKDVFKVIDNKVMLNGKDVSHIDLMNLLHIKVD